MIHIIVLFPRMEDAKNVRNILMRNGMEVTAVCTTGSQVIMALEDLEQGLLVCGYKYSDMMYHELRTYLPVSFAMLLVASKIHWCDCSYLDIVCLSMPIKSFELISTINMMLDNLRRHHKDKIRADIRSKGDKAVIQNAKCVLIKHKGFSENEAHHYLQKSSMDTGRNMMETAYMVLDIFKDRND